VNRLPALSNLLCWIPKIIMNYFTMLEGKITIIHVGPADWGQEISLTKNINYHYFNDLKSEEFDNFLSASDVFLTTNIISSTLAKAVYASVPSIVLQNSKLVKFNNLSSALLKMPLWYQEMAENVKIAYPFRLFPFGWFNFLKAVLNNNPYNDTIVQTCIFQEKKTVNLLQTYLFNKKDRAELQ
jgi:hypothetical protein